MRDFRKLDVWRKSHGFVLAVYAATRAFPDDERFGLTAQLRRSSASVAANIAEGCGRSGDAEFRRFLRMAAGSASESEYHMLLARDLQYVPAALHAELDRQIIEIKRMLSSLLRRLDQDIHKD